MYRTVDTVAFVIVSVMVKTQTFFLCAEEKLHVISVPDNVTQNHSRIIRVESFVGSSSQNSMIGYDRAEMHT
jgi:hypothetical protein